MRADDFDPDLVTPGVPGFITFAVLAVLVVLLVLLMSRQLRRVDARAIEEEIEAEMRQAREREAESAAGDEGTQGPAGVEPDVPAPSSDKREH